MHMYSNWDNLRWTHLYHPFPNNNNERSSQKNWNVKFICLNELLHFQHTDTKRLILFRLEYKQHYRYTLTMDLQAVSGVLGLFWIPNLTGLHFHLYVLKTKLASKLSWPYNQNINFVINRLNNTKSIQVKPYLS